MQNRDDRPFHERYPNFPLYVSIISLAVILLKEFLAKTL